MSFLTTDFFKCEASLRAERTDYMSSVDEISIIYSQIIAQHATQVLKESVQYR